MGLLGNFAAWGVPAGLVCGVLWRQRTRAGVVAAAIAPGLVWLAAAGATGDRRLYFCYSMYFAVRMAGLRGGAAGAAMVALFLAIRALQTAPGAVLLEEALVAAAILWIALLLHRAARRPTAVSIAASLLACAGLAL